MQLVRSLLWDRSLRGNPARVRNCPAAVNENERRQQHWTRVREAATSRNRAQHRPHARESEDLPTHRAPNARWSAAAEDGIGRDVDDVALPSRIAPDELARVEHA